jgi:hypothetical protein
MVPSFLGRGRLGTIPRLCADVPHRFVDSANRINHPFKRTASFLAPGVHSGWHSATLFTLDKDFARIASIIRLPLYVF